VAAEIQISIHSEWRRRRLLDVRHLDLLDRLTIYGTPFAVAVWHHPSLLTHLVQTLPVPPLLADDLADRRGLRIRTRVLVRVMRKLAEVFSMRARIICVHHLAHLFLLHLLHQEGLLSVLKLLLSL